MWKYHGKTSGREEEREGGRGRGKEGRLGGERREGLTRLTDGRRDARSTAESDTGSVVRTDSRGMIETDDQRSPDIRRLTCPMTYKHRVMPATSSQWDTSIELRLQPAANDIQA